ncbi:MAG: phosphatidylinositol-specific phospholipase C domain-containing protein [Candidatus Hydrogenedentales bacterium]
MRIFVIVLLIAAPIAAEGLRLNEIQVVATHNSYHVAKKNAPPQWDYTHAPLPEQLDRGVRGFELDVVYDAAGHFPVQHVPRIDPRSTCARFTDCLEAIRGWSAAHPEHVPIIVHMEVKDDDVPGMIAVNRPELDVLEAEIRSVFGEDQLFTPDDMRGEFETVNEAMKTRGWPLLDDVRGRVTFILHNRGRHRAEFLKGDATIAGRAMFNFAEPGAPDAAFLIRDNPNAPGVAELAREGYIIRTRDGGPNNPERLHAALASGAHLISTDYPAGNEDAETEYVVAFAGEYRCNPVTAPVDCGAEE